MSETEVEVRTVLVGVIRTERFGKPVGGQIVDVVIDNYDVRSDIHVAEPEVD